MKYFFVITLTLVLSIFTACSKGSSDEDSGFSVDQGITNPYAAVTQSNFEITFGSTTYTAGATEKHYAVVYSNGSSAGVACAAYNATGKEIFKLIFTVPSTNALPTTTGSSVAFSSASGIVTAKYSPDTSTGEPTLTHTAVALKMERNSSAAVDFTITKTAVGYSVTITNVENPGHTLTFVTSPFTAVAAQ
jgi:hypothetical protein